MFTVSSACPWPLTELNSLMSGQQGNCEEYRTMKINKDCTPEAKILEYSETTVFNFPNEDGKFCRS